MVRAQIKEREEDLVGGHKRDEFVIRLIPRDTRGFSLCLHGFKANE